MQMSNANAVTPAPADAIFSLEDEG